MKQSVKYVGLDYHQNQVQVCVINEAEQVLLNRPCPNDWRRIAQAVKLLGGRRVQAAIEACCGAADLAEELASRAGWLVDLAHPGYVARMKQSPDKSDFSDARLLADLERVGYVPRVWQAPRYIIELRRLVNVALLRNANAANLRFAQAAGKAASGRCCAISAYSMRRPRPGRNVG